MTIFHRLPRQTIISDEGVAPLIIRTTVTDTNDRPLRNLDTTTYEAHSTTTKGHLHHSTNEDGDHPPLLISIVTTPYPRPLCEGTEDHAHQSTVDEGKVPEEAHSGSHLHAVQGTGVDRDQKQGGVIAEQAHQSTMIVEIERGG